MSQSICIAPMLGQHTEQSSLLDRLSERPMAPAPIDEMKTLAVEVERSKMVGVGRLSWSTRAAGEDPNRED